MAAAGGYAEVVRHLIDIGAAADEENAVLNCLSMSVRLSVCHSQAVAVWH